MHDYIVTRSGKLFQPWDPQYKDVDIGDIAHSLSQTCRFTGHTREFYSVAQHSVLVARLCPQFPLHGLLHDAAEAYTGDLAGPTKCHARANGDEWFDDLTDAIEAAVNTKFGLRWCLESRKEVKHADMRILATEQRDFMPPGHSELGYEPLDYQLVAWPPASAKHVFLSMFGELMKKRGQL